MSRLSLNAGRHGRPPNKQASESAVGARSRMQLDWQTTRALVLTVTQLLALQPLLLWHPSASAQSEGGDDREGGDDCNSPKANSNPDDPDDLDTDDIDIDDLLGEAASNNQDGGSSAHTEAAAGGDYGDGGSAVGDPGGTDGSGMDGSGGVDYALDFGSLEVDGWGASGLVLDRVPVVADPIDLLTADKSHVQVDYVGLGAAALRLSRVYHSNLASYPAQVTVAAGYGWRSYYDRSVQVLSSTQVRLHRANGRTLDFLFNGSAWVSALPAGVLSAAGGGWQYINLRDQVETYGANGRLLSLAQGALLTSVQYDAANRLVRVVNPFGRALAFGYDGANRVASVTLPDGNSLRYGYDAAGNLSTTTFADNTVRQYVYENTGFPHALTGVVDETGRRRLTWGYDSQGRPNYSRYGTATNPLSVVYGNGQVTTTDAVGTQRTRTVAAVGPQTVVTGLQAAATADSAATSWAFTYDGNGNPAGALTRTGEVQLYSADARGRIVSATRAAGSAIALPTQLAWHPVFNKPTQVVQAGVTRSFSIDGYGRVTQVQQSAGATTAAVLARSYNAQGLLQSETDARGAAKTYTYDGSGNRTSVTDALGRTTYFQNFNAHGQATRIQRSDGTLVTRSFDMRGRLTARTVAGRTTTYAYDAAGRIVQTNFADGSWRTKSYDAAGNLLGVTNHRGELILIGRDVTGKATTRNVYSATGALVNTRNRRFDSRGRLAAVTDSRNYSSQIVYGADARPAATVDPLGRTFSQQLDLMDRQVKLTQPNTAAMRQQGGPATVNVAHSYHPVSATHISTVDTNGVATGYGYDALNRRTTQASVDAGTSTTPRNGAGDVLSLTDARGFTLGLTRDAFGRITAVTPPGGVGLAYTYVPGRRDALPASMTDTSGSTAWTYTSEGRLLTKTQTAGGVARTMSITRDSLGRISTMVYPSGMRVTATYSADVVSALSVNGVALLNGISYVPHSQVASGWLWGNGRSYSRSFDADGRVSSVTLGSVTRSYSYDPAGRITSYSDNGPTGTRVSTIGYDEAGQITTYAGPQSSFAYGYDTNGNRRTTVVTSPAGTYSSTNVYAAGTNRLLTSPNGSAYVYSADGKPTTDGMWNFNFDVYGRLTVGSVGNSMNISRGYNGLGLPVISGMSVYVSGQNQNAVPAVPKGDAAAAGKWQWPGATASTAGHWSTTSVRHYFHSDQGQLLGEYDTVTGYAQETIWFNGQPVAAMINGALHYVSADNLGSPRSLIRAADNLEVWRWDSEPFGSTPPSSPSPANAVTYNLRFPGQVFDAQLGFNYNWMRDYSPWTGRYLEPDPTGLGGGLARYTYVSGNPVSNVDPTGLDATVCLYPGAITFGHVGIGINSSSTSGFYPGSNAPGNSITGTVGEVKGDKKEALSCKTISTTTAQDKKMLDFIKGASASPVADYQLTGNNCVNFVRNVLLQAGIVSPNTIRPIPFYNGLPDR